jgi:hypothetical protein
MRLPDLLHEMIGNHLLASILSSLLETLHIGFNSDPRPVIVDPDQKDATLAVQETRDLFAHIFNDLPIVIDRPLLKLNTFPFPRIDPCLNLFRRQGPALSRSLSPRFRQQLRG